MLKYIRNNKDKYDRPDIIEAVFNWIDKQWYNFNILIAILVSIVFISTCIIFADMPICTPVIEKAKRSCHGQAVHDYPSKIIYTISGGLL